jgi:hypothetical protein
MSFGMYNLRVVVESLHPQTGQTTGLRTYNVSFEITLIDNRFPWETPNVANPLHFWVNFPLPAEWKSSIWMYLAMAT